ncbi:hypothetical protein [Gordonia sp. (in: high G+C Gram-positive bacteria)]|uniref:hypothetical protein n=1 Tax=Gordonia sp. (in: high G+C Gram-positive bacteria) TaxID=84139 RepID=UPI003F98054D
MITPTPVDVGRHLFPTFATATQYHQNRPGHLQVPRFIFHAMVTSDAADSARWNVVFHPHVDTSSLGDVVAYRVEKQVDTYSVQRSRLLLLAEDIPFDATFDRWELAVIQAQRRMTSSDVRVDDRAAGGPGTDPERTYRSSDGSETWWRPRVSFHRGVRIETRIKTMRDTERRITAQDATISITDGQHPRTFSVPVEILDQVIAALGVARDDAEAINLNAGR